MILVKNYNILGANIICTTAFYLFIILSFSTTVIAAPWPSDDLAFILGEWEATDHPDNKFRMRIEWSESNNEFLGYLSKQGNLSYSAGFKIGEHIWTARPMKDGSIIDYGKWRYGMGGISSGFTWRSGKVYLKRSELNVLTTEYGTFRRVKSNYMR